MVQARRIYFYSCISGMNIYLEGVGRRYDYNGNRRCIAFMVQRMLTRLDFVLLLSGDK